MATTTAPAGPPIGLLANGATFVPPQFYNLPGFGYAGLDAQMQDAMQNWQKGAGVFAGNNVPKYNGAPGSDPNGTFGGGFAQMAPMVGGGTLGAGVYSGGWNPYAGRGNQPPGPPGTQPPGPPGTQPPYTGQPPGNPPRGQPGGPPVGGGVPGAVGGIGGMNPGLPTSPGTTTGSGNVGGIQGLLNPGGTTTKSGTAGMGGLLNGAPTAGNPLFANTFAPPSNPKSGTVKTSTGADAANPYGLSTEQIYWALSGHPDAIRRLATSLGADGGQNAATGAMTPENLLFHQIVNYYEQGGGGFNGGGYTPQDAFNAQSSYMAGMGTPYTAQQFAPGLPMFASMEEARKAGYV